MYSVLIQNQKTIESFQEFHALFMQPLDNKEMDVCRWVESGTTIYSALPGLGDLINDKEEWKAIIVRLVDDKEMSQFKYDSLNPYDFKVNCATKKTVQVNPVPLVQLTHMLGGIPPLERDIRYAVSSLANAKNQYAFYSIETNDEEELLHQQLSDLYECDLKRPSEIILVTIRKANVNLQKSTKESLTRHLEICSSNFSKRNEYPAMCRFLVYDMKNDGPIERDADMLNFWLSIRLLIDNEISPSSLQAYRLYSFKTYFDKKSMSETLQNTVDKMDGVKHFIKETIANDRLERINSTCDIPDFSATVNVKVELPKDATFGVSKSEFGLIGSDKNSNDIIKWDDLSRKAEEELLLATKIASKSLNVTAERMRNERYVDEGEVSYLDKYQIQDVKDELFNAYKNIIHLQDKLPDVKTTLSDHIVSLKKSIYKNLQSEVKINHMLKIALIEILLIIAMVLPQIYYLIKNKVNGLKGVGIVCLILLVVLVVVIFVVLIHKKIVLGKNIEKYNKELNRSLKEIYKNKEVYSTFMSSVLTYSRGQSYLNILKHKEFAIENAYFILARHIHAADLFLSRVKKWSNAFHLNVDFDNNYYAEISIKPEIAPYHNIIYTLECDKKRKIPFNKSGERIDSSFDFVEKFEILREEIYDDEIIS